MEAVRMELRRCSRWYYLQDGAVVPWAPR